MGNVINIYKTYIMFKLSGYVITLLGTLILVHCSNCDNKLIIMVEQIASNSTKKFKLSHTLSIITFNHWTLKINWWMYNNNSAYTTSID